MRVAFGIVREILEETSGIQRLLVFACEGASGVGGGEGRPAAEPSSGEEGARRAINYPRLTGRAERGDVVAVNCTACDLSLGTGGWDVVTCVVSRGSAQPDPGHVMKLRYAPCQVSVRAVEEQGSPWHEALAHATDCAELPVACCELHSQAMAVLAVAHEQAPELRLAYVMTDEAALVLEFSDACRALAARGVIAATFTCGQATGGQFEAVSLHSALLAAHAMGFDAVAVSMGPGIVGTGTAFGHGGVAQGEAVNACASVGARPLACVRASLADARERHHGISHHTACALGRVALAPAELPLPAPLAERSDDARLMERQLEASGILARHRRRDVDVPLAPAGVEALMGGARVTTMGRDVALDPTFFRFCAACGIELARAARARGEGGADGRP